MLKDILKILLIVFAALIILLTGLVTWWFYSTIVNPPPPPSNAQVIPGQPPVLETIKSVNKQIFIEHYSMVPIVYNEAPDGWIALLGLQQNMVVLIRGTVPAGFDLQEMNENDVWVSSDGKRVQITLPPPTVFEDNVSIDFEKSQIISQSDTCPSFLCQDNLEAYQSEVLPNSKDMLIEFSYESGILNQAARDGKIYYEQLLKSLGFEEIRVIVDGYE